MGDRFVVGFRNGADAPTLYLYSHWGGDEQAKTLAEALYKVIGSGRDDDPAYATRIAISHIIGEDWHRDTGYGISVGEYVQPDYDYINIVDWSDGMVYRYNLDGVEQNGWPFYRFII